MTHQIVFAHLLDDFSGSPKVLRDAIRATAARGWRAKLYVGRPGHGFLSACTIPTTGYVYRRSERKLLTLASYLSSQLILFVKLMADRSIDRKAVIYVNTLLPFGASLYGKLTRRRVLYHIHELSLRPAMLQRSLVSIVKFASCMNIFVSDAHARALRVAGVPARRVYNALDDEFMQAAAASSYTPTREGRFNVLMIASLRDYKGIPEMVELASSLAGRGDVTFELVVNDDQQSVERYFLKRPAPANMAVHPRTFDTPGFYRRAGLVLNLSRVDQWVETFGMTILEAMAFGVPVIVPPVGGPAEIVRDGVDGFLVDSREAGRLRERILELVDDSSLCERMSSAARSRATAFSTSRFAGEICDAIEETCKGRSA